MPSCRPPFAVDRARRAIDNLTTDRQAARAHPRVLEQLAEACYGPRWRDGVARLLRRASPSRTVD